jgi:hypothetical protein
MRLPYDVPRNRPDGTKNVAGETLPIRTEAQVTDSAQKANILQCLGCRTFYIVPMRGQSGQRTVCRKCSSCTGMVIYNLPTET